MSYFFFALTFLSFPILVIIFGLKGMLDATKQCERCHEKTNALEEIDKMWQEWGND